LLPPNCPSEILISSGAHENFFEADLWPGVTFGLPAISPTSSDEATEAFWRRNAALFSRRTFGTCTRRRDRVVGLEARENTVVEMPAVFQAGSKCGCNGFICGRVALDCCWGHLRIQAGGLCRRACPTVTLCTPDRHWREIGIALIDRGVRLRSADAGTIMRRHSGGTIQ